MRNSMKAAALGSIVTGLTLSPEAHSVVNMHTFRSTAVDHCQAFTPSTSNMLRNRVIGVENAGPEAIAVACNFGSMQNAPGADTDPQSLMILFENNNASGSITIICTLLMRAPFNSNQYAVTKKTVPIAAGGEDRHLLWTTEDNPLPGASNMGGPFVGVNCSLPPGALMTHTYLTWNMDNGLGN